MARPLCEDAVYSKFRMDPQNTPPPDKPKSSDGLPAYTPGFGRRLLMFVLCLIGLIVVWIFYWLDSRK